ncbi:MAG TPA: ATP-binding protein, partial [Candidatus Aenigmarchaeota archaeon]|nr:ATP-binding protein [Candidatus Aenigmarchaeota archaeon]
IPDAKAIIVATPQELALADVRKSISFCKHVQMDIIGLVENMSGFICPHCGKQIDIFKSGGGKQTAELARVPFLGRLPVDLSVVEAGDEGRLLEYMQNKDDPYVKAFDKIAKNVLEELQNQ